MSIEVSTSEYRAHLSRWHDRVRQGEDLVITDNGQPVVRVVAASGDALLERLERAGLLRRGRTRRPADQLDVEVAPGDSATGVSRDREP